MIIVDLAEKRKFIVCDNQSGTLNDVTRGNEEEQQYNNLRILINHIFYLSLLYLFIYLIQYSNCDNERYSTLNTILQLLVSQTYYKVDSTIFCLDIHFMSTFIILLVQYIYFHCINYVTIFTTLLKVSFPKQHFSLHRNTNVIDFRCFECPYSLQNNESLMLMWLLELFTRL